MPKRLITHDDTATLGVSLNTDGTSVDNVGKLLTVLKSGRDDTSVRNAIIGLERWFSERLCLGVLRDTDGNEKDDTQKKYQEWFVKHYKIFVKRLCAAVAGDGGDDEKSKKKEMDPKTQVLAFAAVMELARSEHPGKFNNELYAQVLGAAVNGGHFGEELLGALTSRYLSKMDIRFHTYAVVQRLSETASPSTSSSNAHDTSRNLYDILSRTPVMFTDYKKGTEKKENETKANTSDDDSEDFEAMLGMMKGADKNEDEDDDPFASAWCKSPAVGERAAAEIAELRASLATGTSKKAKKVGGLSKATVAADEARKISNTTNDKWANGKLHRKQFQEAWLSLLRKPFPSDVYRKVLLQCHKAIMPHMQNPSLLSDFFITSIDRGGLDGMLALNGLFTLMTRHDLEYPRFYDRLYRLLDTSAFHSSNRKGFFELLDIFLKSSALPGYLCAAFIKRLARLSLTAPPAGAMTAAAFIHNLLRRHPGCEVLVHRGGDGKDEGATALFTTDPFLEHEQDPAKCKALESSLWELATLKEFHYFPQVGKMASLVSDKNLSDRVKTAELPVGDVTHANYNSLIQEELTARVKTAPVAYHKNGISGLFQTPLMKESFPSENFAWQ